VKWTVVSAKSKHRGKPRAWLGIKTGQYPSLQVGMTVGIIDIGAVRNVAVSAFILRLLVDHVVRIATEIVSPVHSALLACISE